MRMVLTAGVLCAALLLAVTAAVHAAPSTQSGEARSLALI